MIGTLVAAAAVVVQLAGGTQFLFRVSRSDLRPPPAALTLGMPLGACMGVVGLGLGLEAGEPRIPLVLLSGTTLVWAAVAYGVHRQRRIPRNVLQVDVGEPMLAFSARTPEDDRFDSSALAGRRVLLKFFRGEWCPFCQAELKRFEALRPELEAHGVEIVAISKDTPEAAHHHRERDGLGFTVLCDPDLTVIRRFGVEHHKALEISGRRRFSVFGIELGSAPGFRTMAIPTTLLVDEQGIVRWIDQTDDYMVRSSVERVLTAVTECLEPRSAPMSTG